VCRINQLQHDFGRLDSWCVFALTKFNAYSGNLLTRFARYFHFDEIHQAVRAPFLPLTSKSIAALTAFAPCVSTLFPVDSHRVFALTKFTVYSTPATIL
jgi:hypothetical protein